MDGVYWTMVSFSFLKVQYSLRTKLLFTASVSICHLGEEFREHDLALWSKKKIFSLNDRVMCFKLTYNMA